MIGKNITEKIIPLLLCFTIIISLILVPVVYRAQKTTKQAQGISMNYEKKLFTLGNIINLNIEMDQDSWNKFLDHASKKKYYSCNVTINGETFYNVGIRTKGGSSLDDVVAMKTSNRYSFMLKFDKFTKGQTYYGLDKLALNNNIGDATSMKDSITYDMASYIGLDAPLFNYANISVNGNYFSCYLALEGIDSSFCQRNYGKDYGNLYRPYYNLCYTNDKQSSYEEITMDSIFSKDEKSLPRIVNALKSVETGKDIEKYVDVDSVLKYLAIQTMAVNLDGLTGTDAHNFYLYEKDGKISLIPWDYNLAYGGFIEMYDSEFNEQNLNKDQSQEDWEAYIDSLSEEELKALENTSVFDNTAEASRVINFPINTPFTGKLSERSFFMKLLENETYKTKYYEYLSLLSSKYIQGGKMDKTMLLIKQEIGNIVGTESNAFYTNKQFYRGVDAFNLLLNKKALSILGQIDGTIPATWEEQKKNPTNLIDSSNVILSDMGGY